MKVSLVGCASYENALLKEKIAESLRNIGVDARSFRNKLVAVKPNLLTAEPPETAVVTHPAFVQAVVQIIKEQGGTPVLVESPATIPLERVLKKAGYDPFIAAEGLRVADPKVTMPVSSEDARKFKTFEVSRELDAVDIVINLPKLKTHGLTVMSCAVKNLFGTIYGMNKTRCHMKARNTEEFSNLLLDLYTCLTRGFKEPKQFIHLVDAVVGMEGDGPGVSGSPRQIGAILAGTDAIAVDFVAAQLIAIAPKDVLTIAGGAQRGLGFASWSDISLAGEELETLRIPDFRVPLSGLKIALMNFTFGTDFIRYLLVERPVPQEGVCTLCFQCRTICPAGAISQHPKKGRVPVYDYNKCIRCYCCMEICPAAAIHLSSGWILKLGQFIIEKLIAPLRSR